MADKNRQGSKKSSRKFWGFIVVWLILFLIVKSIEKILLITAVGAALYWGSKALKGGGKTGQVDGPDKSLDRE